MKSNKEVTLKTRETFLLYRKPQKLKIQKYFTRKFFETNYQKIPFYSVSRIVPNRTKSGQLSQK